MSLEYSPIVRAAQTVGFEVTPPLAQAEGSHIARQQRIDSLVTRLDDGSYQAPDTLNPTLKRVLKRGAVCLGAIGLTIGATQLLTYDSVRPNEAECDLAAVAPNVKMSPEQYVVMSQNHDLARLLDC